MKRKKICIILNKKKICLNVVNRSFFQMFRGLMFYTREKAPILLYESNNPKLDGIHSWFVFFDFLAIWVDGNNNVLKIQRIKPFQNYINCKKSWKKLIEVPISKKYDDKIKLLVGN